MINWVRGRQDGGNYFKCEVFSFRLGKYGFDCYLIKYPTNSYIPPHVDPVDDHNHYRLNMVIKHAKLGGKFIKNGITQSGRIFFFRPDRDEHQVSQIIKGTRYVFSLGLAVKNQ